MDFGNRIANIFQMDDRTWARHANPWSGATRIPILPALCAVIFFRDSLGGLIWPILAILVIWAFWNPRAFSEPTSTKNWMSEAVFGERVWLNRKEVPIPQHHARAAMLLSILPITGILPMVYGLVVLNPAATALGCALTVLFKLWFLDRMVWLYRDMAPSHTEYAAWQR
ncbi:MAG: DUF6653 family protein [Pseudomonadota bacterium]